MDRRRWRPQKCRERRRYETCPNEWNELYLRIEILDESFRPWFEYPAVIQRSTFWCRTCLRGIRAEIWPILFDYGIYDLVFNIKPIWSATFFSSAWHSMSMSSSVFVSLVVDVMMNFLKCTFWSVNVYCSTFKCWEILDSPVWFRHVPYSLVFATNPKSCHNDTHKGPDFLVQSPTVALQLFTQYMN